MEEYLERRGTDVREGLGMMKLASWVAVSYRSDISLQLLFGTTISKEKRIYKQFIDLKKKKSVDRLG